MVQTSKNDIVILSSDVTDVVVRHVLLIAFHWLYVSIVMVCTRRFSIRFQRTRRIGSGSFCSSKSRFPYLYQGTLVLVEYVCIMNLQWCKDHEREDTNEGMCNSSACHPRA